jgi:hypothetical protein
MDPQNLSTVMGTNLIWSATQNSGAPTREVLEEIQRSQEITRFLIQNYENVFCPPDVSPFEKDALAYSSEAVAVLHTKLVGKHRAITSVCYALSKQEDQEDRIWTADEKGVIHVWNTASLALELELDAGQRVNTMIQSGESVWVGTIGNIQIRNFAVSQ